MNNLIFLNLLILVSSSVFLIYEDISNHKVSSLIVCVNLLSISCMQWLVKSPFWLIPIILLILLGVYVLSDKEIEAKKLNIVDLIYFIVTFSIIGFVRPYLPVLQAIIPILLCIIVYLLIERKRESVAYLAYTNIFIILCLLFYVRNVH